MIDFKPQSIHKIQKEPESEKLHACLVKDSLANDCSWDAKRLLTSFNSAANDTTLRLKLCFFSFKSLNRGSISWTDKEVKDDEDDDEGSDAYDFSELDIIKYKFLCNRWRWLLLLRIWSYFLYNELEF